MKKMLILNHLWLGETDVWLSIWTQPCWITTVLNTGVFNHYATTAHEPSRQKSIVKFNFEKVIFGAFPVGDTPRICKKNVC